MFLEWYIVVQVAGGTIQLCLDCHDRSMRDVTSRGNSALTIVQTQFAANFYPACPLATPASRTTIGRVLMRDAQLYWSGRWAVRNISALQVTIYNPSGRSPMPFDYKSGQSCVYISGPLHSWL